MQVKPTIWLVSQTSVIEIETIDIGDDAALRNHGRPEKAKAAFAAFGPCDEATGGVIPELYRKRNSCAYIFKCGTSLNLQVQSP